MECPHFTGRVVLVVEDEPLVGLDLAELLKDFGARVLSARNVKGALALLANTELSAAVLDINLAGEDCSPICQRLSERGISYSTQATQASLSWKNGPMLRS